MAIRRLQHRHPTPETTDLERWVQAYERILKPLIAYMFLSEPRFLDHLTQSFAVPMQKSRHKQDHTETDDHAEAFFRAVMGLDAAQAATEKSARSLGPMRQADQLTNGVEPVAQPHSAACRVEVHERAAQSPARVRDRAFRAPPGFTHEERMAMQGPSKSTAIFERPFNTFRASTSFCPPASTVSKPRSTRRRIIGIRKNGRHRSGSGCTRGARIPAWRAA
jgi:hypothetical protein